MQRWKGFRPRDTKGYLQSQVYLSSAPLRSRRFLKPANIYLQRLQVSQAYG